MKVSPEPSFIFVFTLAQASAIPRASVNFFRNPFTTRICAYFLILPRLCSCALVWLQKFVHLVFFPPCALVPFKCGAK